MYTTIIHNHWAKKTAIMFSHLFDRSLFIFDMDESGKELLLAEQLNRHNIKTLLVQHGAMFSPSYYIPTCNFMACCSIRSKKALINEGIDNNRLFVIGQPFQTLTDSKKKTNSSKKYDILILASGGRGFKYHDNLNNNILKNSKYLNNLNSIYIRPDPRMNNKDIQELHFNDNVHILSTLNSLGDTLSNAKIVITFSIDALISSLRQHLPTVVCIPEELYIPSHFDFLNNIQIIKVARNSNELDNALSFLNSFYPNLLNNHHEIDKQIDYMFGSINTVENFKKLLIFYENL